jgi:hypothetical protein
VASPMTLEVSSARRSARQMRECLDRHWAHLVESDIRWASAWASAWVSSISDVIQMAACNTPSWLTLGARD